MGSLELPTSIAWKADGQVMMGYHDLIDYGLWMMMVLMLLWLLSMVHDWG